MKQGDRRTPDGTLTPSDVEDRNVSGHLGYRLGQSITLAHGAGVTGGPLASEHGDKPFTVVGILARTGTPFRQRVWAAISAIPRGRTATYGALAAQLGSAPRAVGQACGANPFPLIVPCHRVTAASGLGGFANAHDGWLLDVKRWLLAFEGAL